ncbi:TIGR02444 family protein [Pusillimonas noertemannii]|uniref:Uncharacterized protein (TIGR02444 family) n=1 Tax=Pusillimonas noertemannii TaxID=305977 RepID=A0A2U1CR13_9BURK|nr:TIGR02444 family protein [Pusillimonas noertemannii]NYT67602.1 TIGR02444 family protein [Pusillimonas noertemannii]PVY68274.1 uncharacterized protein (TIGR02444 family) [Pusillimonas noertemannii]TFL12232.1 TIGR02444 family protein [Pusillimonas noertemannii]
MRDELEARFDELWEFSLSTYKMQGVSTACLRLQDEYDLDVNVLLLCLFAGSRGHTLSVQDFTLIETRVSPWRKSIIQVLRAARRSLKSERRSSGKIIEDLYTDVLATELKAEQYEQYLIASTVAISKGASDASIISHNLVGYLRASGTPAKEDILFDLAKLLSGVMEIQVCDATSMLRGTDIDMRENTNI